MTVGELTKKLDRLHLNPDLPIVVHIDEDTTTFEFRSVVSAEFASTSKGEVLVLGVDEYDYEGNSSNEF